MAVVNVEIAVPFQGATLEVESTRLAQIAIAVPFQSAFLDLVTPNVEVAATIEVPFQGANLAIGEAADSLASIGIVVPFQEASLFIGGAPVSSFIVASLLSKIGSFANLGALVEPGPLAFSSQLTCDVSDL